MAEANELVAKGFRILRGEEELARDRFASPSEGASACFKEAIGLDSDIFEAWIGLGIAYAYDPKKFDAALAAFLNAKKLNPENPESWYQLGRLYFSHAERNYDIAGAPEYEQAIQFFHEAAKRSYESPVILYDRLGTTYFRLQRYDEALESFERSAAEAREASALPSTYFLAAQINELKGNLEEALRWYESYIAKGFDDEDVRLTIRNLKAMLKNRHKAL